MNINAVCGKHNMKKYFILVFLFLIQFYTYSQNDTRMEDFGNLKRFSEENKLLWTYTSSESRVVFMGNSITEFWGEIDSSFFEGKPYINRGISGQTTSQMLLRFRQDVINLFPAVVVILAGINDIAENTGPIALVDVFGNIVSMCQLARANDISIVLSSVLPANNFPWNPGLKPAEKVMVLNHMLKTYCTENNIVYLDYYLHMVNDKKGLDKELAEDGVHPTLAGYKVMEPLVERAIRLALNEHNKR